MKQEVEKRWVELYLSNIDLLDEERSTVLNAARSCAMESFNLLGLPVRGSGGGDRYHYTDLRSTFAGEYEHYFTPSYLHVSPEQMPVEGYHVGFVNGFCCDVQKLTVLDNGLIYGSLAQASVQFPELVGRYYHTLADSATDAIAALTAAFVQDGAFVYVPRGVKLAYPILVESTFYAQGEAVAFFGRDLFVFEEGAGAQIVLDYQTQTQEQMLAARVREVFVGAGAGVELVELCRMNGQSTLVSGSAVRQERDSRFESFSVALSGALVRGSQRVQLVGPGAENHTNGVLLAGNEEHLDLTTEIEHLAPDCTSYELVKAVASAGGVGVFAGRIYVAPDAQRTQAFQRNNNLLLSEQAHIYTKPQLEIYADNVKCSHGATVGQLDDQAIYYMRQRGLSQQEARRLQMHGFAGEVLDRCSVESLRGWLEGMVMEKIDAL